MEIRSDKKYRVVHNPWDKTERDVEAEEIRHWLADTGGIESQTVTRQVACHCGCVAAPGGFCGCCHEILCVSCYTRCDKCSKPVGPCCSVLIQDENLRAIRLCKECGDALKRKSTLKMFLQLISLPFAVFLSLFIKFEE